MTTRGQNSGQRALPHRKSYYWEGCCLIENLTSCRAPKHEKTRDGMMSILSSGIPFKSSILNEATVPQIVRFFREAIRLPSNLSFVIGHLSFLICQICLCVLCHSAVDWFGCGRDVS